MAKVAAQQKEEKLLPENRPYLANIQEWEDAEGNEFGGSADIVALGIGEVAGPFLYSGSQQMNTELGETTVHTANDTEGHAYRLPISATFLRAVDQACLIPGDEFLIRRMEDQIKKSGKGKGQPMQIYALKVTHRVPRAAAPAMPVQ